jgi:AraC-like DNA-binding protein
VQIHDSEVACDGLLFNNLHNIPVTALPGKKEKEAVDNLFSLIKIELEQQLPQQEEMLRVYLKQLIILSTRLWRLQQLSGPDDMNNHDVDFFRRFSLLVDIHYKEKHSVADYADIMSIAPKTITHKLRKMNMEQPNEFIKNRIILEAKRLLIHTAMSAKQIAYHLGYEDPAYFNRLFSLKVGSTPADFRKKYN